MRDDRDDPFDDFFREIERMMNEMMGAGDFRVERHSDVDHGGGHDAHMDVHEGDDEVRIVADIPGVDKEAIDLKCDGRVLNLEAASATREYRERVDLPAPVDEHSARATYNNGVLEVVFDRKNESTSIDI